MLDEIRALADSVFPEVVRLRRAIHERPELAFEEEETARLVAETLRPLGMRVQSGVARTGVVSVLEGDSSGPTIALRADMDALPIQEDTGLPFASHIPGRMHACGHDVHTASLLGTAMILSKLRGELSGSIQFIFQPSEERLPGGALAMIEDGLLDGRVLTTRPSRIYGQHVLPELATGKLGVRSGMYMASADEIYVTVRGEGGHAAAPHRLRSDAVVAAAHVIVALQTVIARNCPPNVPSILSIGRVVADGATNVIPESVRLEGTFRAMDEAWRERAHELMTRVIRDTASSFGAAADVEIVVGYPALFNDPGETDRVRRAAEAYVGHENVVELEQWYASEDFAWYLRELPGSFYRLGTAHTGDAKPAGLHTPQFTVNEEALRLGCGFMAFLAISSLHEHA